MKRRTLLQSAASLAGLATFGGVTRAAAPDRQKQAKLSFTDAQFRGADGKFDVEKGKDAIEALCQYHGYPIFPDFRQNLWVSDYDTGEFTKLGLAAYMFVNNVPDRYMLMDLFLLPGQMLPEHWHLPGEDNPAKREGWLVRWGASHIVGIGQPNLSDEIVIPPCHCNGTVETKHETLALPGMFVPLAQVGTKHWQYGGPAGAIITEVANVHTESAVRHSDPKLNDFFLSGGKS